MRQEFKSSSAAWFLLRVSCEVVIEPSARLPSSEDLTGDGRNAYKMEHVYGYWQVVSVTCHEAA